MERDYYNEFWSGSTAGEIAEYFKFILPDLEHLDAEEVLLQQESAYEYYMKSNPYLECGESSNHIEGAFLESQVSDDEALARAVAMLEINHLHISDHSTSLDNTGSNVTAPPIEVYVGQSADHDEMDPDIMTYEQLQSLGDAVGHESKGLSKEDISQLPIFKYKVRSSKKNEKEECVICCDEFKKGTKVTILPCVHSYHSDCIAKWLEENKHCPVCQMEVNTSNIP